VESLLTRPLQIAQPHALPFRVIFEEHRRRRERDLLDAAFDVLKPPTQQQAGAYLLASILHQESTYKDLADATEAISVGTRTEGVDQLLADCRDADDPLKKILHLMDASALCLSGGGIRSASYCLGVLEGLSRISRPGGPQPTRNLMDRLDYLSTVSGGGYIGSWLMSWVYRRKSAMPPPPAGTPVSWKTPYSEVVSALAGQAPVAAGGHPPVTGGDPEPQPLRHLRAYTSFLAPKLGLTLDTFTLGAIVLRNLFVNWIMLVPALFVLISFVEYSGYQFQMASNWLPNHWSPMFEGLIGGIFVLASLAAATGLPSHLQFVPRNALFASIVRGIRRWTVGIFICSVIAGSWLLIASGNPERHHLNRQTPLYVFVLTLISFGLIGTFIVISYRARIKDIRVSRWNSTVAAGAMAAIATAVCSAATCGLLYLLHHNIYRFLLHHDGHSMLFQRYEADDRLFIVFALPLVLSALMLVSSLFCALMGIYEMEEDREWWVRCGGCFLLFNLFWIVGHGLAFYGRGGWHRVIAGCVGLALGMAGSAVGFSGATSAGPRPVKAAQLSAIGKFLEKHDLVLPAVSAAALFLIALGAVAAEEKTRMAILSYLGGRGCLGANNGGIRSSLILFALSAALAVLINFAININLFSLHGMYRMRLMRAFLGASNVFRRPNPFTNFDPKDTPHEIDLPGAPDVPLHIVNTTLNLVGTNNTAWAQRKAECFTFSPIHAGSWRLGYVPADIYGGTQGVTLATAMAISGAAFNPNMGYQSSPLLSLIMTFFNVRLGCWLPNPKGLGTSTDGDNQDFLQKSGPSFALKPLIEDALGLTNDTARWIELTDGGHFENLGLYEMVMRRCKHIIVVDAGADPDCQFEDLGNAMRKIFIDLGVSIRFENDMKMEKGMQKTNKYCAVAKIDYGCVDPIPAGKEPGDMDGRLVYIKAGLTGLEPVDILQYAKTHPTFPHETTENQFYNEAQFESYRHLGSFVMDCLATTVQASSSSAISNFISGAFAFWLKE